MKKIGNLKFTKKSIQKILADAIRYFDFVRRADELLHWLRERLALAEREDYGQDLEECEQLAQQFQQVVRELASAGERVAQVLAQREELLRGRHPNAGSIRAKGQAVQPLWREVNEAANERQVGTMGIWGFLKLCSSSGYDVYGASLVSFDASWSALSNGMKIMVIY